MGQGEYPALLSTPLLHLFTFLFSSSILLRSTVIFFLPCPVLLSPSNLFFLLSIFHPLWCVCHFSVWSVALSLEVPVTVARISHSPPPTHSCRLASGREALWRWGTMCGLALSCTLRRRSTRTTCPSWLWRRRRLSSWRTWTHSVGPAWGTPCRAANSSNSGEN